MSKDIEPNTEAIFKDNDTRVEWKYYDEHCKPVHTSKILYKNKPLILIHPYSYSQERGLSIRKIKTIELRGWYNIKDIPTAIRYIMMVLTITKVL